MCVKTRQKRLSYLTAPANWRCLSGQAIYWIGGAADMQLQTQDICDRSFFLHMRCSILEWPIARSLSFNQHAILHKNINEPSLDERRIDWETARAT
jgi:hypothetical protein